MSAEKPLVSCIIIFLNAERYLEEAIESVRAQSYANWELLLVDDGSSDGSTEIARRFARECPGKIHYLEHEGHVNRGMSATRNLGFRHARGKYVALLDGDDVWLHEKLERQVAILEAQPDTGMVFGPTEYWYSWTGVAEDRARDHVPELGAPPDSLIQPPELLSLLYPLGQGPAPCLCALLIRHDVIERVGGFEESFAGFYEDQAFLTKVYLATPVFASSGCWDRYRIHPASCSATVERAGEYAAYRQSFLEWFKHYLKEQDVKHPDVWDSLNEALQPDQSTTGTREHKWFLRVADDNGARLIRPADRPDVVRVEISRARSPETYDIQLNLPGLKVQAGDRLALVFRARADRPRTAGCGFAMGHSPWKNLGLYRTVELLAEWTEVREEFVVEQDESDARVHFDLGAHDASVEIAGLVLQHQADGRMVTQERAGAAGATGDSESEPAVPFGEVEFGSFRRLTPISRDFGCDRGRPIDRYYIENFLDSRRADVRGRVLEIGENTYTRRYGGDKVTGSDILHIMEGEPNATIIADLATADHIPSDTFDCIILTQTLQLIYDVHSAARHIYRILKPGGVLLATFPGISQTYDHEWSGTWYWNFTALSARRLFNEAFGSPNVEVEAFGNVLAAVSFLHGLAVDELTTEELDHREPGYDVSLAVRAIKASLTDRSESTTIHGSAERQSSRRKAGGSGDDKSIVLMYHRVAEGGTDPFSLAVTPAHFAEQIEVLGKHTTVLPLQDFALAAGKGELPKHSSVVTFDDGYADNLLNAKPLLERFGAPATVFLTTGYIGGEREFWWDEVDRVFLQPGTLPRTLHLEVDGENHEWDLGEYAVLSQQDWQRTRSWKVSEPAPTARHEVFYSVWRLLQFTPDEGRRRALDSLCAWAGLGTGARASHRLLSANEVSELVVGSTIEAGAHTMTHPVLARLPLEDQQREIEGSKSRVQEMLGRPVLSFSYPFGSRPDFSSDTMTILRDSGFTCACSTVPSAVTGDVDVFQLPRVQVNDWNGQEFGTRLTRWLDS